MFAFWLPHFSGLFSCQHCLCSPGHLLMVPWLENVHKRDFASSFWPAIMAKLGCVCLVVFWLLTASILVPGKRVNYKGVRADTKKKLDFLEGLSSEKSDGDIDFWTYPSSVEDDADADILVSPKAKEGFEKDLKSEKIHFEIISDDIQREIDQEMKPVPSTKSRKRVFKDGTVFDSSIYNTWEQIEPFLWRLPDEYPSLVSVHTIGQSHEGRNLVVVKVGTNTSDHKISDIWGPGISEMEPKKPAIWIDSGIHAREWITPATILFILDNILYSYQTSRSIKVYLDEIDWYFLPVMNPDGYSHSHTHDRMWRKNRSQNSCTFGKKCCQGTDLNRNFDYFWGGSGSSSSRCSNTYAGSAPFSEPETRAVRDFVLKNNDSIKAFMSFHSYAQSWRHPYAYRRNTFPEDIEELRWLARNIVLNIQATHNVRYKVFAGGKIMSGVARDWAKGVARIKYVYCVELASRGSGFVAPISAIIPSGEENWAALTMVAEKIIEKYLNGTNSTVTEGLPTVTTTMLTEEIGPSVPPATSPIVPDTTTSPTPFTSAQISTITVTPTITSTNATQPNIVGGSVVEERFVSSCLDLNSDCAQKFDLSMCYADMVVRALCRRYCGDCID